MKKEIWRKVKGFPNYKISNRGKVVNVKTGKKLKAHISAGTSLAVSLSKNSKKYKKSLARLVLKHFTKKPPKFTPVHKDGNNQNNTLKNLKRGTRSEMLAARYRAKQKLRGIYTYKNGNFEKWRAAIQKNNKQITVGYFDTKKEAIVGYYNAYKKLYGVKPFSLKAKLK